MSHLGKARLNVDRSGAVPGVSSKWLTGAVALLRAPRQQRAGFGQPLLQLRELVPRGWPILEDTHGNRDLALVIHRARNAHQPGTLGALGIAANVIRQPA